jgi:hypothetical protein
MAPVQPGWAPVAAGMVVNLYVRVPAGRAGYGPAVPAVIAAAVLLGAAAGGLRFLGTGVDGASLVRALCAAIAICCYSLILYRLPGAGPQPGR